MKPRYTNDELNGRLRFIVGCALAVTMVGTIFTALYGLLFVSQPMEQSPNDAALFDLITPIATFLVGTLSGVMLGSNKKDRDGDGAPD
jgi:hypothetical protein